MLPARAQLCVCAQGYGDDDYLVFDCPGQIELYNHLSVFTTLVDYLRKARGMQLGWQ